MTKTAWLILAFVIGILAMFAKEAKAETGFYVAPETVFIRGERITGTALEMVESWGEGKYEVSIMLIVSDNLHDANADNNAGIALRRVVRYKKFGMGLGIAGWQNQSKAWNTTATFSLDLRWDFNEHWTAKIQHFSTGGSSSRNSGLDMLQFGYRF